MQLLTALVMCVLGAGPDNNVEWNGVSHYPLQDRRPVCPVAGESFQIRFQAYRDDLTSASVVMDTGAGPVTVAATRVVTRGPYDIWAAQAPQTNLLASVRYYIELTDGAQTDYLAAEGISSDPPVGGVAAGFVVNFATLEHAPLGATPVSNGGAVFKVWAPTPTQGWVRGTFNGWGFNNPMTKVGEYFTGFAANVPQGAQYKYYFEPGALWRPDPRSRALSPIDGYNSKVWRPESYAWTSGDFATPAIDDLIIYELHVGTFAGRNDPVLPAASIPSTYVDVRNRVAHLVELGVNCVEVMPINEFPYDFSAGYNPVSAMAIESKLGTPDEFKSMVDALHANGIAVMLDIVWNHFSPTDNFLWDYDGTQVYFDNPPVQTPWGSQADFDRSAVRSYFLDTQEMWLGEFRLDGFRMDATSFMNIFPQAGAGWSLMQAFNDRIKNRWVDKVSVAEQLPNDYYITRPTNLGGAGFDAQWWDPMTDTLRGCILDAAFGDPNMGALAAAFSGGAYLQGRELCNYLEMHDEAWPSSGGQRLVNTIDTTAPHDDQYAKGRHKLGHGFAICAPGVPMFLQGTEWLEDTNFGGGDAGGADRIDWSKKVTYRRIFNYYRDLIRIKKQNGAFRASSPYQVYHVNDVGNVIAFQRYDLSGNVCVVIANFSNTDYTSYDLGLPQPGAWYELINSQDPKYDGDGPINAVRIDATGGPRDGHPWSANIRVPAMGLIVLRSNVPPCVADFNGSGNVSVQDLFDFLAAWFAMDAAADINRSGGVPTVQDLFDFLAAWFGGCG